jgi:hypothetical protein
MSNYEIYIEKNIKINKKNKKELQPKCSFSKIVYRILIPPPNLDNFHPVFTLYFQDSIQCCWFFIIS